jgi:hypothetical protein
MRDYAEVSASLPVFRVSLFAYQRVSGRFRQDEDVSGFSSATETEIPALREHVIDMTRSASVEGARRFLNGFFRKMNSLYIWTRNHPPQVTLASVEKLTEVITLQDDLSESHKVEVSPRTCIWLLT